MSTVRFARRTRRDAPRSPGGEVSLQPPPDIPRAAPGNLLTKLLPVVMVAAMVGMMALMFTSGMARSPMSLVFPLMMMVSMAGMLANNARGGPKTAEADEDRKDYLRYLDKMRRDVADTGEQQRRALEWSNPDPALLWTLVGTVRMWERGTADPDFCHVRIGVGTQRLATRLIAPETGPVEDLEPVAASALRRFVRTHSVVPDLPTAVSLRSFPSIAVDGDRDVARHLARAVLAQLCTFHGPDLVQVAVVCGPDTATEWEWVKWLPHAQHADVHDGAGTVRMVFGSVLELETVLATDLSRRGRFVRNSPVVEGTAHLVVVVDGGVAGSGSGLLADGLDAVTVLDLSGFAPRLAAVYGLQLVAEDGKIGVRGGSSVEFFADTDALSIPQAQTVARRLAPFRAPTQFALDDGSDDGKASTWQELLGLGDVGQLDPVQMWAPRPARDRLRVPIGYGPEGAPIELDLKEAAENGMGPHGLCIGATGSGKSEFLRTLVLGLVATHSPDALNLVLVDFKGGATFLGLEGVPHVAAVITNLADELAMVERMKDALEGEMNRRQELLRSAGNFANVGDYERARAAGAPLAPLPALFVVVDEFSELLTQQPEFAGLFTAIGRLGRSLHMHLLLATQRIDEGKLRGVDSHLSYRIALKTFSANESRSVLGVADAYGLPSSPGAGYLKCDSAEIVRFDTAYVSGPYTPGRSPRRTRRVPAAGIPSPRVFTARVVPADPVPVPIPEPEPQQDTPESEGRSVFDVVVAALRGHGTPAHEVWLPPLDVSPPVDRLLPRSLLTGDVPAVASLRSAIGIVDRPYDQRRDPLVVDLSGALGNVVVVGGPQSGKSTLLRTLVLSTAATHTAEQVQFYCLDFGGGALAGLAGLPHVGSVANRLDADRVRRTVAELTGLLRARERQFGEWGIESMAQFRRLRADPASPVHADPFGDVILVIDGWSSIRQDFEPLEEPVGVLAARGLSFGIHVVLSAPRWADVRSAVRDHLGTRLELRLGDPTESEYGRKKAELVPQGRPGRGIDRDGLHVLIALPRIDGSSAVDDLGEAAGAAVAAIGAATPGRHAPPVRMLPDLITVSELATFPGGGPAPRTAPAAQRLTVPIGISESELAPVAVEFADSPHLLVFGDSGCGKTSLLRGLCRHLMASNTDMQARLIVADYRRTLLGVVEGGHLGGYAPSASVLSGMATELAGIFERRLPGPETTQQQLRDRSWWTGPEVFVVVDDYDLVATSGQNPLSPLLDYLPQARDIGLHLIIARRSGGAGRALYEPVIGRLRELATPGLVMSGNRDEGALIGSVRPGPMPPGRGTLVRRNGTELIQTAWSPLQ